MSEQITIQDLLDLQGKFFAGQSGITLEATIKETRQAYERKVKSGDRAGEIFYSQKLVIDDGTGSIVVDFIAGTKEEIIPNTAVGRRVKIEDAKTDIYKGERRLVRGKLTPLDSTADSTPSGAGVSDPKQEERDYWDSKQDRKGREISRCALAKEYIRAGKYPNKDTIKEANTWAEWVANGAKMEEEPKSEEPNEIDQAELPEETSAKIDKSSNEIKETPKRAAFRKTFHSLRDQLVKMGFWDDDGKKEDSDYRIWLDDEFQVPSSSYLSDEEMEKGIKIMAKWLNEAIEKKKEE